MTTTKRQRQFSLGESFKRVQRKKEEEAAAVAATPEKERRCEIPIMQPRKEDALLAGLQHVRLDSFEHRIDNRKYSLLPANKNKENVEPEVGTAGEDHNDLGHKFISALSAWPQSEHDTLNSQTMHDVALVCYNDPLHADSNIAERAQCILRTGLKLQPPCTIKYITDTSQKGSPLVATLQPCAPHAEPWAGQVSCVPSANATASSKASANSKAPPRAETASFGFKWMYEQIKHWDIAVKKLLGPAGEDVDSSLRVVKKLQGPLWVAMYLLDVWSLDLKTRLKVVSAHDGQRAQLKECQKMIKESYACRTYDINFTHTQLEALFADGMGLLAHCPTTPAGTFHGDVISFLQGVRDTTARCLRLLLELLGATEDLGMSLSSSAFVPMDSEKRRHDVDPCLSRALDTSCSAPEWCQQLPELAPRDRIRALNHWLASKYVNMGFKDIIERRHGTAVFTASVRKYGKLPSVIESFDNPGTFLHIPAGVTMRALAHPALISRFLTKVLKNDIDMLAVLATQLTFAAIDALPELMQTHRFRLSQVPLHPVLPVATPTQDAAPSPAPSPSLVAQMAGGSAANTADGKPAIDVSDSPGVAPGATEADKKQGTEENALDDGSVPASMKPGMQPIPEDAEMADADVTEATGASGAGDASQPLAQDSASGKQDSAPGSTSQSSRRSSISTDVEMKPALAPLEVDWSFGNTHARHDRARWLSEAHCNQGMRSELEALLWGLVSVMLRIAKHQGVHIAVTQSQDWTTESAQVVLKQLIKMAASDTEGYGPSKALSLSVWQDLDDALILLEDALQAPGLQGVQL